MTAPLSGAAGEGSLRLQVGGTLVPGRDLYITRPEDDRLFRLLGDGEYVNILSSRQVGKSSLMLRTAFRLKAERGCRFAVVDLTALGTPESARAYFRGLVGKIARQLRLDFDAQGFWCEEGDSGTYSQQFIRFFREIVAERIAEPVVIFLDEIDSTLKFPYTDDLFTSLRSMYNERALVTAYQRIVVCLVGVATPDELIKDRRTTPYNVGKTLSLGDFDPARDDLTPLAETLSEHPGRGAELLARVLHWTGGHPFLTTRLCQELHAGAAVAPGDVDRFVDERYTRLEGLGEDDHIQQILRFVRERLTDGLGSFSLYERILKGEQERDLPSLAHAELKLSGLVKRDHNGLLVPRNRIYAGLFRRDWVRQTKPKKELTRARLVARGAMALLLVGLLSVGYYYQTEVLPLQRQEQARQALEDLQVSLTLDFSGFMEVGLPAQDWVAVLQLALPHLQALASGREGLALALDLSSTSVTDLTPLAALSDLKRLSAANTGISNLAPLAGLKNLEVLEISSTSVEDLAPLASLTGLRQIDVSNTQVRDLAPLASLNRLEELDIARTQVKDLAPIANLPALRHLALDGLGISGSAIGGRNGRTRVLQDPPPRAGAALRLGESFRDCPACPEMIVVPAGRFMMGSPEQELGRFEDEGPRQEVVIRSAFAVAKYEVRFDEWGICVRDGACRDVVGAGFGRGARPAIYVSQDDAKSYADWLSKRSGKRYRLPSEAEWEYAARGGTTSAYPWGDDPGANRANFANSDSQWSGNQAAPVGSFAPNRFGLHDMIGNVWEWTEDCYHSSYDRAPSDGRAWMSDRCSLHVLRGGGWSSYPQVARSAFRLRAFPGNRDVDLGFRLARTLP